jgi:NAD(P)-dependent dehydrogenase (short-subunit alcohol dehydrogenase family)
LTQTIVVTGAARGIGAATARLAARRGYAVAINYRAGPEAPTLADELRAEGADVEAIQADVSTLAGARSLFAAVDRRFGGLDVLIANAGITGPLMRVEDVEEEALSHLLAANVSSLFYCSREAIRRMSTVRGGKGGSIVILSSAAARHGGRPEMVAYTASKGAADAFTLGLARELAGSGIRVNALRPGVIATSIHDVYGGRSALDQIAPSIPLGRTGDASEVAAAALWLASAEASYVHGALLDVGGGR